MLSIVAVLAAVPHDVLVSVMATPASTGAGKIERGNLFRIKGHRGIVIDRAALFPPLAEVQAEGDNCLVTPQE